MIAMDPKQTATFHLLSDAETPEAERPVFVTRHLTCREKLDFRKLANQAAETKEDTEAIELVLKAIGMGLVDWRQVRGPKGDLVPFAVASLPGLLTDMEVWEVVEGILTATSLAEADLKKSASQSDSGTEPSAEAVPAETSA